MNYTVERYEGRGSGQGEWVRVSVTKNSFTSTLRKAIRVTRRSGDARRIRSTRQVFVTIKYGDNRTTAITFSLRGMGELFDEAGILSSQEYNRGHSGGIDDTLAVIAEDDAKATKKQRQNKRDAIATYNRYLDRTSGLQRAFNNTPRLYQCRHCDWWFARLNPPKMGEKHKCPYCRSTNARRVR